MVQPDLVYEQQPVEILDYMTKGLRGKELKLVRIMWRADAPGESTWEREDQMRERYPHLFSTEE